MSANAREYYKPCARLKKLASKEAGFSKQLDAASGHEAVQERADALMAYSYNYKAGATELEAQDFTTGEPVMLEVDPEKGPWATGGGRFYKRTRKTSANRRRRVTARREKCGGD